MVDNSVAWYVKVRGQKDESNWAACALTAGGRLLAGRRQRREGVSNVESTGWDTQDQSAGPDVDQ